MFSLGGASVFIVYLLMLLMCCCWPDSRVQAAPLNCKRCGDRAGEDRVNEIDVSDDLLIMNARRMPLYKLTGYFVQRTEKDDAKVRDLLLENVAYYTHIYLAWMKADQALSLVAVSTETFDFKGANMVVSIPELKNMFAHGRIEQVLDFVLPCYRRGIPNTINATQSVGYVSTLRSFSSEAINRKLISETAKRFLVTTPAGSFHLLWENRSKMHDYLVGLNYTAILCGSTPVADNPCDWKKMGLKAEAADDLCLYRLVNE